MMIEKISVLAAVCAVSICINVVGMIAICEIYAIHILWYYVAGAIVIGFVVAYGAMYGYDNLYCEFWKMLKGVIK